jgi:uncharacterized protein YbaR (Trm112 family)
MSEDQSLLDLLACPKCHGKLAKISSPDGFACERCALFFAIEDGLPNMLIEEAKAWPQTKSEAGRA